MKRPDLLTALHQERPLRTILGEYPIGDVAETLGIEVSLIAAFIQGRHSHLMLFDAETADLLTHSAEETRGAPKKEFRGDLVAHIKSVGVEQYVDELLAEYRTQLDAYIAVLQTQIETMPKGKEFEEIFQEELAEATRAFGISSQTHSGA